MASFTDSQTSFTEYQSEVPVQALIDNSLIKQREFDAGVAQVQQQVDSIAALPIVKQQGKEYLQAKLGQLKSTLSTSVASDFSDQRLINQIGGLTKQIGTDPIIQGQVQSSLNYQQISKDVEQAKKDGKYGIENEWDVASKASNWLQDGDLKSTFSDKYTPYVDVYKKAGDVFKALHESGKVEQIPWVVGTDGKIDYSRTAAATLEKGIEGVSGETIRNALRGALNEEDLNQLSISGRYQFRNVTPEQLLEHSNQKWEDKRASIDADIKQLKTIATLNTNNPALYNKAIDRIRELTLYKNGDGVKGIPSQLKAEQDAELSSILSNPEAAKAEIYKNGFIDQFSSAFSWEKSYTKYVKNEIKAQENWEKEYGIQAANLNLAQRREAFAEKSWGMDYDLKLKEFYLKNNPNGLPPFTVGGMAVDGVDSVSKLEQSVTEANTQYEGVIRDIVKSEKITPAQAQAVVDEYNRTGKLSINNEKFLFPVRDALNKKRDADVIAMSLQDKRKEAENDPSVKAQNQSLEEQLKQRGNINFHINGENVTFTPKEFLSFLNKEQETIKSVQGPGGVAIYSYKEVSPTNLSAKEKKLYESLKGSRYGAGIIKENTFSKAVDKYAKSYFDLKSQNRDVSKKIEELYLQKAMPLAGKYAPTTFAWLAGKAEEQNIRGEIASLFTNRALTDGGGNAGGDPEKIMSILTDKTGKNAKVGVQVSGNDTYLIVTPEGKTESQTLKLTDLEAQQIKQRVGIPSNAVTRFDERIAAGDGQTNPHNIPELSFYQKEDFSNIQNSEVRADATRVSGLSDGYGLTFRVMLPSGWKSFPLSSVAPGKYLNKEQAEQYIRSLTIDDVKQLATLALPQYIGEIKTLK